MRDDALCVQAFGTAAESALHFIAQGLPLQHDYDVPETSL